VKTGISDGNFTEIVQGDLQQGQQVAIGVSTPDNQKPASGSPLPRRF
jgi:hypothetical protein